MPYFPIPDEFEDEDQYLEYLTLAGAKDRYGEISDTIKERIDFELSVIKKMGFPGYFLIVRDFLDAARKNDVSVGPGRGSAAGSVVAYCNRITDIDPIKYNLLFERFLNPDRISMPDIDIDFDEDGRERVLDYVIEKYGENRVAHIITFGSMAAKMAIRDVARVLKLPLVDADKLAKYVPEKPGITFKKAYQEVKELRDAQKSDNELVRKTLRFAEILEGSVRHTGLHACGIIIGKNDLIEHLPLCKVKDTRLLVTQYEGSQVEDVGMLKMDFLGLKTLSIIKDAVDNIKISKGVDIDIENIPLDDQATYNLYSRGETTGLFQFESGGMKKYLKDLKPNRFEDLIAMNALYRPGPMDYIPSFINRKHGKEEIKYDLPVMEEYLKETYGITVYQEQVMLLSRAMAGFSGGQADSLRKAMGKKKKKLMAELKEKFMEGCKNNGYDEKTIQKVWTDWEAFAQYAFNKSHSTCYAYVSYQTGYLKTHYPAEFMAAVLSRNINDIKKITVFMDECKRMGISVLGPDVNESNYKFTVNKDGNIRFGLGAIKGVGENAVVKIIEEREKNGTYKGIYDFVERVSLQTVNKKNIEALALAGAFDNFTEIKRHQFFIADSKEISFAEYLIKYGNKYQNDKNSAQRSLFGEQQDLTIVKPEIPLGEEWDNLILLNKEKEVIGIYLSAHPLDNYKFEMDAFTNTNLSQLHELADLKGREINIAGIVTSVRHGTAKNGKPYGVVNIEDYTDSFQMMFFSNDYLSFKNYFVKGYSLLIKGRVKEREWGKDKGQPEFNVKSIELLADVKEKMLTSISLKVPLSGISDSMIQDIMKFTDQKNGKVFINFIVYDPEKNIVLEGKSRNQKVDVSEKFLHYITENPEIEYKVN
jgi:DNA polymerase-3 subunit alpha